MLMGILAAGAVACLAYFVVIVLYSGIETAFAFIWFLFAAGLGLTAFSLWYYQKFPGRIPLRLPVSLVTLCCAGAAIMLLLQFLIIGRVPQVADSGLEYVIVLGAKAGKDGPGRTLRLRLDKAAEYAMQNPETILVLSGGQIGQEPRTEAQAMMDYLLEKGVPKGQMVLESRSTSTKENIAYSWLLIEELKKQKHKEDVQDPRPLPAYLPSAAGHGLERDRQIGILTSNFHLFRAMQIARKQGLKEICGIASPSDRVLFVHLCFRDGLAVLKERLVGNL